MISKQKNLLKMISSIIKDRIWSLRYSFRKRNCYFTGQSLWLSPCYLGRKKITNIVNQNYIYDDIWVSKKEFLAMIKNGVV